MRKFKFVSNKKFGISMLIIFIICCICSVGSFIMDHEVNKERNELLDKSTLVDCHVTSVVEKSILEVTDSGRVKKVVYDLAGTYMYNDKKCVVGGIDTYDSWKEASAIVGTDKQIYIQTDRLGVAGASVVHVPFENGIFKPLSIIFVILSFISAVLLILYWNKKE